VVGVVGGLVVGTVVLACGAVDVVVGARVVVVAPVVCVTFGVVAAVGVVTAVVIEVEAVFVAFASLLLLVADPIMNKAIRTPTIHTHRRWYKCRFPPPTGAGSVILFT
jgi:hypothetical protein